MIIPGHIPAAFRQADDSARRCADAVNLAAVAGCAGMWVAVQLQDGRSDGNVYDSRSAAISHQLRPQYCTYVRVPPDGMQDYEAKALLDYWRDLTTGGVRDDDPDQPMPLMPLLARDRRRQVALLKKGRLCLTPRPRAQQAPRHRIRRRS